MEGQCADLDLDLERRAGVEQEECLQMVERKTGALVGCACAMGARFGGGSTTQVEQLRRFGQRLAWRFSMWTTCWASGATRR